MLYPLLNKREKYIYKSLRKTHGFFYVLFLFLFVKIRGEVEHFTTAQLNVKYKFRLITRFVIFLLITVLCLLTIIFSFKKTLYNYILVMEKLNKYKLHSKIQLSVKATNDFRIYNNVPRIK